jgi:uncharacterized membrane protein YqjE
MANSSQSFRSLGSELIGEITRLIRQELRLAQAEAAEKTAQIQSGLISILVGLLLALAALLVLLQALVIGMAEVMPAWLAAIAVGVVVAIIAYALVRSGQSNLSATHLVPERTVRSVQDDKNMILERAR